ncbi:hypothetical protein OOU_Y34scaffold00065g4 [Pyricularia oryzae Y34]|uniref:Uncharacterized protein n=3 Tax=Pyricularia oryzae TaxID=318829 RepID=A0A4P7MY21_PYROR|nr:hypothetical protein OOU_Y34scaffold00065g4 [Pyricularia oryzae Y34]QBZ54947.1 hypothetical protein PoMZ_10660 [Pyricularia oryzae]
MVEPSASPLCSRPQRSRPRAMRVPPRTCLGHRVPPTGTAASI